MCFPYLVRIAVAQSCSVKNVLLESRKIYRKTAVPGSLFQLRKGTHLKKGKSQKI